MRPSIFLTFLIFSISLISIIPGFDTLRGPIYERLLDLSFPIFFYALTDRCEALGNRQNKSEIGGWLIFAIYVSASALTSLYNFGINFFLVEYRQYVLIAAAIVIASFTKRFFSPKKIIQFARLYFFVFFLVILMNRVVGVFYRPGVFGESNYDLAALAIIFCAFAAHSYNLRAWTSISLFSVFSLSRTSLIVLLILSFTRVKKISQFIWMSLISIMVVLLVALRAPDDMQATEFDYPALSIDRIQMTWSYIESASENNQFMLFGQALTSTRLDIPQMYYYRDTQPVSSELGISTPSNFHGHLLRGFALLGIPMYLLFVYLVYKKIRNNFSGLGRKFLYIVILVTGFSQSIFSHPLVGTLLFSFIWTGLRMSSKRSIVE